MLKNLILLPGLFTLLAFSSCQKRLFENVYVYKGNHVFGRATENNTELHEYEVTKCTKVKLSEASDHLEFKFDNETNLTDVAHCTTPSPNDYRYLIGSKKYFMDEASSCSSTAPAAWKDVSKLRYFNMALAMQGVSIPFRVRPTPKGLNSDTFPTQAEGSLTVGLSLGFKLQHNVYVNKKNIFGSNTYTFSFTPGIILAAGIADINKANTDPVIALPRKVASFITGGFLMFGFNRVNIGYAFGIDVATGEKRDYWVYHKKLWHGIIIGFDILK